MQDFRQLKVWEEAHSFTLQIYTDTKRFPSDEKFGLTSQIRRSTLSIPANICEGCGRNSKTDFARFLQISYGSASETEYHLLLAKDLAYLEPKQYDLLQNRLSSIKRMLFALIKKLKTEN